MSYYEGHCKFCGREARIYNQPNWEYYYDCPSCGNYFIKNPERGTLREYKQNKVKSYLFYHKSDLRPYIISKELYNKMDRHDFVDIYNLTPEMVENWYPKTFAQKVDLILCKLGEVAPYEGAFVNTMDIIYDLFFCVEIDNKSKDVQAEYIFKFLKENGYIIGSMIEMQLTPKAYERIYELHKEQVNNKNIFVSMAFNNGTKSTREAIRQGILNAGYSPEFIDEIIHNHQIMPEMFRLIRESRLLILEISDPNYGAYYEAGYALGLGKEVIICCKEEVFTRKYETDEDKKYEKYMKPHFDIAQKQILVWKDEEDLIKKLPEWIKAVDGR